MHIHDIVFLSIAVIDKETRNIIDEWVSTDRVRKIMFLFDVKLYIITEIIISNGYNVAGYISFVAKDSRKVD